jgi:anti-sigma factor RsiW
MTREFPDELLSAFLDDELSPAERAQVERHLTASPADRQLLTELKTLRGEVAGLPAVKVNPGFADRVVRAAFAEAEKHNGARGVVSRAPPGERHFWRRWKIGAAVASAAALAACVLLVVLLGRRNNGPEPASVGTSIPALAALPDSPATAVAAMAALPDQLVSLLAADLPSEREAVVLRLRTTKDVSIAEALDAALAAAGIQAAASSGAMSASLLEQAYQKSFEGKLSDASVAAAEAIFIEAPCEKLQGFANELASHIKDPLRLEAAGKLALGRAWDETRPEGEAAAAPFMQRLNAGLFKLQKTVTDATAAVAKGNTVAAIDPQRRVRVLILIEPAE